MKFRKTKLMSLMVAAWCSSSLVNAELFEFVATSDPQKDQPLSKDGLMTIAQAAVAVYRPVKAFRLG